MRGIFLAFLLLPLAFGQKEEERLSTAFRETDAALDEAEARVRGAEAADEKSRREKKASRDAALDDGGRWRTFDQVVPPMATVAAVAIYCASLLDVPRWHRQVLFFLPRFGCLLF